MYAYLSPMFQRCWDPAAICFVYRGHPPGREIEDRFALERHDAFRLSALKYPVKWLFLREILAVLTCFGDGVRESGSYVPIKQAISWWPGRLKGGPAEVILPPGVRGDSRKEGKKERERAHPILLSDHRACIALTGISPFCTPTWTRACAHILLLYNTDRERWRTERVRATWRTSVQWGLFVSASKCGLKKAAFPKGEISWNIRICGVISWHDYYSRSGRERHFVIYGWLWKVVYAKVGCLTIISCSWRT